MIPVHRRLLNLLLDFVEYMSTLVLAIALVALASAVVLTLTGCGGGGGDPDVPLPHVSCVAGRCA